MARNFDQDILNSLDRPFVGTFTGAKTGSLFDSLAAQANEALLSNPNYLSTLQKIQQSNATLSSTTNSLQSAIGDSSNQLLGATKSARTNQAASGLGNSGLGVVQGVDTADNDRNLQKQISNSARANRETLDSIKLYEDNAHSALYEQMYRQTVNNRKSGVYGKWNAKKGKFERDDRDYWNKDTFNWNGNLVTDSQYKDLESWLADHSGNSALDPVESKDKDWLKNK